MWFFLATIVFTQIARRTGWWTSKRFLYTVPAPLAVTSCLMWGGIVAASMHLLIVWLNPHWMLKWIFGYAQGAYASVPNFGLIADATVPPEAMRRHLMVSYLPLASFIVHAVLLGVFRAA